MIMEQKRIYDVRGKQSRILRLIRSDLEGFIHMLFYRLAIIVSFFAALSIALGIFSVGNPLTPLSEKLIFIMGILMISQIFEFAKGFVVMITGGAVFGRLNRSFLKYGVKPHAVYRLYKLVPYIVTIVWVIILIWLGVMWSV